MSPDHPVHVPPLGFSRGFFRDHTGFPYLTSTDLDKMARLPARVKGGESVQSKKEAQCFVCVFRNALDGFGAGFGTPIPAPGPSPAPRHPSPIHAAESRALLDPPPSGFTRPDGYPLRGVLGRAGGGNAVRGRVCLLVVQGRMFGAMGGGEEAGFLEHRRRRCVP